MKNSEGRNALVKIPIATADGEFAALYSDAGLAGLSFPANRKVILPKPDGPAPNREWHQMTVAALQHALAGREPGQLPPLDLSAGTVFQQSVWQAMRRIRVGQTRSYGEIARAIGRPMALRAVGGACGANPIPVLVPCHRVVAANRRLGGFSADMNWKRTLLTREGVVLL